MGRDKRKGKELVVEPLKKKKTHTQKEAECAAMAARFTSLEPGPTSTRMSESVCLPVGRFVSVRI
jgi:hypothetical protein